MFSWNIVLNVLFILFEAIVAYRVEVKQGTIKGTTAVTVFNEQMYLAFYGIPYARPPIGNLRFKNPRPLKKWKKPVDGRTVYHGACAQAHIVHKHAIYGNEDCLYMNVFTPNLYRTDTKLKAVVVWIHGYAFTSSFSHIHGADFFIENDVIVVTLTHRIGAFGFLKLNETDHHSNMGLKDIVMALKWIRKNIKKFGGDRSNLTVMGSGSAATFLSLLMVTEANKLFARAILQSGTMFSSSLFQGNQSLERKRLRANLKKKGVRSIRKASSKDIVLLSGKIYSNDEGINSQRPLIPFLPVIEAKYNKSLLTRLPEEYFDNKDGINMKPILIGFNSKESISEIIPFLHNPRYLKSISVYFKYMVPFSSQCKYNYTTPTYQNIATQISREYFKDGLSEKSVQEFLEYSSDLIKYPIYDFIRRHNQLKGSRIHVYKFSYSGNYSVVKLNSIFGTKAKIRGAASGDEICYMLKCEPIREYYATAKHDLDNKDRIFIRRITELWANFAKTGDPTPNTYNGITWPPMTESDDNILNLGNTFNILNSKKERRMFEFWNDIYQKYYKDCGPRLRDEF